MTGEYLIQPHEDGSILYTNRRSGKAAWLHKGRSWWAIRKGSTGLDSGAVPCRSRADAISEIERMTQ